MTPRELWEFDYPMLETFTKPCYSALLRMPYMSRYFSNSEFRQLFPELHENAHVKESVPVSKLQAINNSKAANGLLAPIKGAKYSAADAVVRKSLPAVNPTANGSVSATCVAAANENISKNTTNSKYIKEVEVGSSNENDELDNPQNFIFAYRRRIIVGDASSRKFAKEYNSYAEMTIDLKKYFPTIPSEVMDKAMQTFEAYEV